MGVSQTSTGVYQHQRSLIFTEPIKMLSDTHPPLNPRGRKGLLSGQIKNDTYMTVKQICVTLAIAAWCSLSFCILAGDSETMPLGTWIAWKAAALAALLLGGHAWHKADKKGLIIKID